MSDELILGWDVGGTKSAAVLATPSGSIAARQEWPSHVEQGPSGMIDEFLTRARSLMREHGQARSAGVSIGGPLNALTGTILSPPHLPGWDRIELAQILARELGIPLAIEHDAAACLEAEWLWGAACGSATAIYLTCGTGMGAGIMIGGRILRGPGGQTPEVGHIRLADDGPIAFGKAGSVESFCSGDGIAKLAPFMFPDRFRGATDTARLHAMDRSGDTHARAVLARAAHCTGQLCAMLADIFAPEVIMLGSLSRYLGPWWIDAVREEFLREVLPANGSATRIVPPGLGEKLQDLSAIAPCVFGTGAKKP